MNKIKRFSATFLVAAAAISLISVAGFDGGFFSNVLATNADEQVTAVNLNQSVTTSTNYTSTSYSYNEFVTLDFTHVKQSSGNVGVIKAYSTITKLEASYSLTSVNVSFSGGSLTIQTWYNKGDLVKRNYTLVSGVTKYIEGNYFRLTAGNADVTITSLQINSSCLTPVSKPTTSTGISSFDSVTLEEDLTHKEHYWVLHGTLSSDNTFLADNMEIFDGNRKLSISEIYVGENKTYQVRCNIFASAASLGTTQFYPHMRFGNTNVTICNSSGDIQVAEGKYPTTAVNTYKRNTYTPIHAWSMPCLQIDPIRTKFYHDSSAVGVTLPFNTSVSWDTNRSNPYGNNSFRWYYRVFIIQANKYFNFVDSDDNSSTNDSGVIDFYYWDSASETLHKPTVAKSWVSETVWVDGEKYELICFYLDIYDIVKSKYVDKSTSFYGTNKDTVLFQYSYKKAKSGNGHVEVEAENGVNNDINLAVDNAKSSSWQHIQALPDESRPFYYPGYGSMYAHIVSQNGKAGFGMYK